MNMSYQIWSTGALASMALAAIVASGCSGGDGTETATKPSGCAGGVCAAPSKSAAAKVEVEPAEMNTAALVVLMRKGAKMQLLEARPKAEELIPGAKLVAVTSEDADILKALPDKKALYVTYCGSAKCSASAMLAKKLREFGYQRVIEFRQGWSGWSEHKAGKDLGEPEINAAALNLLMNSGVKMSVLDARTGKYDDGRRVPGAGNLSPMSKPAEVAKAIPDKDQLVVTYCTNLKCPASKMLAKNLSELGYRNVIEFPQGIEGWAASGYPVKKAKQQAKH